MKKDIMDIMLSVPTVKQLAKEAGLYASYVPVLGSIMIMYKNTKLGISHDARTIELKDGHRENLTSWLRAMKLSRNITNLLHVKNSNL